MKRIICLLMVCILFIANTGTVFGNNEEHDSLSYVQAMEKYVSIDADSHLTFDAEKAISDGFDREAVAGIVKNILTMNELIDNYGWVLNEDYSVSIIISMNRGGVTKVETYWYGLTKVYLNSTDTQGLINYIDNVFNFVTDLYNLVNYLTPIVDLGPLTYLWDLYTSIYLSQIQAAAAGGNGIIMNIFNDQNYNQTIIYYEAQ